MSTQSLEKTSPTGLEKALAQVSLPEFSVKSSVQAPPALTMKHSDLQQAKPVQWFLKRVIDIVCSSFGIVLLLPLLVLVAIGIKLESPGPIIYKQQRVGLRGRRFDMYKFRSMRQDADAMLEQLLQKNETNNGMFKMFNDPRVTKIGRFIRKYSIDELPQLFNVLKGDMSLVGPRPPIVRELKHYENWHYFRFSTLPGLTGIWQVSGRSRIKEFDTVVKMDYHYINNWNLLLDMKLILKTVPVVLGGMDTA